MSRYIEWNNERKARYDDARARAEAAIRDCVRVAMEDDHGPGDEPFVQELVAVAEWTNIALEQEDAGGRFTIAPQGQTLSAGLGLAEWAAGTFAG